MSQTIINSIEESIRNNWERQALTDFNGVSFQYRDIARKVAKLHILFENAKVKKGDKIAICGKNSSQWVVAFVASVTYGAVTVPILHEFKADNIHHLMAHSEAKLLFIEDAIWENLDPEYMPDLQGAVKLGDFSLLMSRDPELTMAREHLNEMFGKKYPERFTPDDVVYHHPDPDEVMLINYTSGSTGFSKGVMLRYSSIWSNVEYCIKWIKFLEPGDSLVCMLPLAHMYGLSMEMIFPFVKGCHLYFLTRVPSPRVILEAFSMVKPKLIITVPLIIEKIVKTKIFPKLETPTMKVLLRLPIIDDRILAKVNQGLIDAFGGNVQEIIVGGAGLNQEVEEFLMRIGFPITTGYGMTECGPLISYASASDHRLRSCGRCVDRMECRIDSPDPENIPGELQVRGMNVMKGYFKNPEATESVFKDGWMSTGDLCTMDSEGFIFIRGRNKNMILGPSGQNIYPEEIEQKLNNLPYVGESIVVEKGGRLVALIYPDIEIATKDGVISNIEKIMEDNVNELNKELPAYSQITKPIVHYQEFEKTPKRSIKRYLYQD